MCLVEDISLLSADLDFGKASSEGYTVYDGTVQPINGLLEFLEGSECNASMLDIHEACMRPMSACHYPAK